MKQTKTKANGGFAFPALDLYIGTNGMSLRDYFAAKAMAAYLMSTHEQVASEANGNTKRCAEWAYQNADAMLEARKQ